MSNQQKAIADEKIRRFEAFLVKKATLINSDTNDTFTADEVTTKDISGQEESFYYFIGRLNPPHNGHIAALKQLVELANANDSVPLILLGSGPGSDDESRRTMDNPITFEAKEEFIKSIIPGKYIIKKMSNPAQNVSEYISSRLVNNPNVDNIKITHIAGGKDEDATKLSFALKSAEKTATTIAPNAKITATVNTIEPETTDIGTAMSATKVRKDAYKTILNGTGFEGWPQQYKEFYGTMAKPIYDQILHPLNNIPDQDRKTLIETYITSGMLPPAAKKATKRKISKISNKGGSNKKGKKNKNRRNYKKTQKKGKRISKRKY
jgi:nicotinamide mononucleotide adenylyltransferase